MTSHARVLILAASSVAVFLGLAVGEDEQFETRAIKDPISGSRHFVPELGQKGIIHCYIPSRFVVLKKVEAWIDVVEMAKFYDLLDREAKPEDELPGSKTGRERRRLKILPHVKAGHLTYVADMTPAKVVALSLFDPEFTRLEGLDRLIEPDEALVEILDGPLKSKHFWVSLDSFRVPGSKTFAEKMFEESPPHFLGPSGVDEKKGLLPPKKAAKILVEDTATTRNPVINIMKVDVSVRNISDESLDVVICTIVFRDRNGKMLQSDKIPFSKLEPGDSSVQSAILTKLDYDYFDLKFEGTVGDGERGMIQFTTPDETKKASKKKGRRR